MANVDDEAILLDFAMLGGTELFLGVMPQGLERQVVMLLRCCSELIAVIPSHRFSR